MNEAMKQEMIREVEAIQFDAVEILNVLKNEPTSYGETELKMLSGAMFMAAQAMQELAEN